MLLAHLAVLGVLLRVREPPAVAPAPAAGEAISFDLGPLPAAPVARPREVAPGPPQHVQESSPGGAPGKRATLSETPLSGASANGAEAAITAGSGDQIGAERNSVDLTSAPPSAIAPDSSVTARVTTASSERDVRSNWQSELLGHLKRFRRYPRQAERLMQQGISLVSLSVDRDGKILAVHLVRSSGYPLLDAEATATSWRGSPVPPPSADIHGDPVVVEVPIQFSLKQ